MAGHSYPYFARAIHFRLGEVSGRSPVIYGQILQEQTNKQSSTLNSAQFNFILTNGRSFVSQQFTDFILTDAAGPTQGSQPAFNFALFPSQAGPSQTSAPKGGEFADQAGPTIYSSGQYDEIRLINKFGHRTENTTVRGFNVAQTQPRPLPFDVIVTPEILRHDAFAVWLDAADKTSGKILASPTDNSVVSWINKAPSGTAWVQDGADSTRPVFVEGLQNGLGGMTFDGVGQFLSNINLILASTSGEIFVVVNQSTLPADPDASVLWGANQAGAPDKDLQLKTHQSRGANGGPAILANNTAGDKELIFEEGGVPDTITSGVPYIMCFRSRGEGVPWEVDVNGTGLQGTETLFAAHEGVWHGAIGGLDNIDIGMSTRSDTPGRFWQGTLFELVGYEAQLGGVQSTGVLNYLADKWQIPLTGVL